MNDKMKRVSAKPGFGPGDEAVLRRLGKVKLLCLDVDGVLTDGGIYYRYDGHLSRK